jgi:transposase InsO family protein
MKPARKREMVDHVRAAWRVSIRRACRAVPVDRSTYHYRSKRAGQAPLAKRTREIAETRLRYGYRRIHVLLRREGWQVNVKRVCRLYREQGLQLRNKSPKRRVKAKPAGKPVAGHRSEPGLGHGLRPRPAFRRPEVPGADDRRHLHPAVAGDRVSKTDHLGPRVSSETLAAHLGTLENRRWPEWSKGKPITKVQLARLLAKVKIKSGSIRFDDGSTPKGYYRKQFEDIWSRYGGADSRANPEEGGN